MADYMSEEEQSPQVVSKRKKSSEHQLTDSDVGELIYSGNRRNVYTIRKIRIIIILISFFHIKITSSY